jgi:NADH-quinone oxidoreductase subunit G
MKVTIDGIEVEVEAGTTILAAARKIGGEIVPPAMCYYTPLKGSGGKCRTCLVKVAAGSAADPRPMPKLVPSCSTVCQEGMIVENITNPQVLDARKGVTEFLLINHPLDCPVCDQAGECHLQDLAFEHGMEKTRYHEGRREFEQTDLGDNIKLHMNRCIMCFRCVMTADQLTQTRQHGILNRGDKAEIGTYIEQSLDNEFIGNVIDVCPVGALTDKTFRFKSRVWFTNQFDAHRGCDKCCGKVVLHKVGNEIVRVSARKDQYGEVTGWICNTCRFETKSNDAWTIEKPHHIDRHSVQSQGHYELPVNNEPKELR